MNDPLFPTFAFIGFILSLLPLSWHIQAWNSGTCAFMIWTALPCLTGFVNSIVWNGNVNNPAPIWCDICTCFGIVALDLPDFAFSFKSHHRSKHWNPSFDSLYQQTFILSHVH